MASDRHQKCYVLLWPVSRKWNILCIMFKMGPTSGARTAYPSGAPKFAVLSVLLSFGHCVVCPSVLLSFGHCAVCPSVFWPLCCLSFFDLWILITRLVSSNSSCNNDDLTVAKVGIFFAHGKHLHDDISP